MKKRLAILLCLAMLMTMFAVPAIAADTAPSVVIDGQTVNFDVAPIIDNGRTMVPLRAIFEKMGATVSWDDATKTASAVKGDTTVVVAIGSASPTINGALKVIDVPAKIINGRTIAPMRFVCEAFGGTVSWDADNYVASVVSAGGTVTPTPTPTPIETRTKSPEYKAVRQQLVLRLDNNMYRISSDIILQDDNGNYYLGVAPLSAIISAYYNDYRIEKSNNNPFIKGDLCANNPDKYVAIELKYLNATQTYCEGYLYNDNKTKSYSYSSKPNEEIGILAGQNSRIFIPLNTALKALGIQFDTSIDGENGIILMSFK